MKCWECEFYAESPHDRQTGVCEIKLPPWLVTPRARVNYLDGCDLGRKALRGVVQEDD